MNLLHLRKSKKWSQEFVARQLGVSRNSVKNWEDGVTEPSVSMGIKIANLFDVTVDELMKEEK